MPTVAPALEVHQQVAQAAQQVVAAGLHGAAQDLGVGQQEVGRAHRLDELAGVEVDLLRGARRQAVDVAHDVLHVAGGQQVGLLDEVEHLLLPGGVAEARVLGVGLDHRRGVEAPEAARGVLPEGEVVLPEADLRLHQPGGVGHQPRGHVHERAADVERVGLAAASRGGGVEHLPAQPVADQAAGAFGDVGHGAPDRERVRHRRARWPGRRHVPLVGVVPSIGH